MRIAIIGTGSMGSLFAGLLSTVADIIMIGSWAKQLRLVTKPGLNVLHLDGSKSRRSIAATSLASDAFPADIALILVKGWQTAAAAVQAQKALAPAGLAVTLQNGLGNLEILAEEIGSGRAIQGVTSEGATLLKPGLVRHAGRGHTYVAASKSTRARIKSLADLFDQASLETSIVDDARSLIWGKLAVNAGINPLTALLQVPNGWLLEHMQTVDIMTKAAREVALVANALGVPLPFEDAAAQAIAVAKATAENRSSMAQDIARGMPTEIEQINGAVVRYGRSLAVPTPVNEILLQLVRSQISHGSWRDASDSLPIEYRQIFRDLSNLETQR